MNTSVCHQVGLDLGGVNVEGTIESEGRGQRGDRLRDQTVQVGVRWALNVKAATADVIDGQVLSDRLSAWRHAWRHA